MLDVLFDRWNYLWKLTQSQFTNHKTKKNMKYKYVIDCTPEGKFHLTDTRDGISHEIAERIAAVLISSQDTLFSTKARFAINSVDCVTTK